MVPKTLLVCKSVGQGGSLGPVGLKSDPLRLGPSAFADEARRSSLPKAFGTRYQSLRDFRKSQRGRYSPPILTYTEEIAGMGQESTVPLGLS